MAGCQDLVDAVNGINDTLVDIRDNYLKIHDSVENTDVNLIGLLLRIDRSLRYKYTDPDTGDDVVYTHVRELANIEKHLAQRLPSREFVREAVRALVEVLQYNGDSIAERLAQAVQKEYGAPDIAPSNMEELTPLDVTQDANTQGLI